MAKYFLILAAGTAVFLLCLLLVDAQADELLRGLGVYVAFVVLVFGHAVFWAESDLWVDEETKEYRRRGMRGEQDESTGR